VGTGMLSLVSFALILPFLILSFTSAFYRDRLKDLLRVRATPALPAATVSASVAAPGIQS